MHCRPIMEHDVVMLSIGTVLGVSACFSMCANFSEKIK